MTQGIAVEKVQAPERSATNYLNAKAGLGSWLTSVDHKRIGVVYLVSTLVAFTLGGLLALALSVESMAPGHTIMTAQQYAQAFTLHGAIMAFLVVVPAIPGALSNFVLPMMVGAKGVAFPRLNLVGLYLYWVGAVLLLAGLAVGGLDGGWTLGAPSSAAVLPLAGIFAVAVSSALTGLNAIATMHKLRAPGMSLFRLPLFAWSMYATSVVQLLAAPVLGILLALLVADPGAFDAAHGGNPLLFQEFFWLYCQAAVYLMIVPAMGIVSELISAHAHRRPFDYKADALSTVAIAFLGCLVWGQHLFVAGQSGAASALFSLLALLLAVPVSIKMLNWLATLWRGSIALTTPMAFALSFLVLFAIGSLSGLFLGMLSTGMHLYGTTFVVAHLHYVMLGGTLVAFLGGLHHWWPKLTGRMFNDGVGKLGVVLVFVGINVTFFVQLIAGSRGLARRSYGYLEQFQPLQMASAVGSFVLFAGLLVIGVNLLRSRKSGAQASDDPWGGKTLEWKTQSPPITENFATTPSVVSGPYDG